MLKGVQHFDLFFFFLFENILLFYETLWYVTIKSNRNEICLHVCVCAKNLLYIYAKKKEKFHCFIVKEYGKKKGFLLFNDVRYFPQWGLAAYFIKQNFY